MPKHVISEIIFCGVDDAAIASILSASMKDDKVDFGILVPMPLNVWQGSVGKIHEQTFGLTGLDWATKNWGTKWNAYDAEAPAIVGDMLTLRFQSAWSPPFPWLAALFNHTKRDFAHNWLDEGASHGWSGSFRMTADWGPEWKQERASDEMQRHLHKLIYGVEAFDEEDA